MLNPQSWLPQAQELALGQRRRTEHDCGDGPVLIVEHKPDGWSAWCHRCNDKGWHPAPTPSLAERLARLKEKDAADKAVAGSVRPPLPGDFNPALWPLYARVWLYQAGFSNDRIRECGFYYHPRLDRVVLPVLDGPDVVYWQARGFDKLRPKYLNPAVDKSGLVARYGAGGSRLVLTEDILSAARVGEVCEAWSILGTSLGEALAARLLRDGRRVAVWLDPDKAGRKGRARLMAALRLYGLDATIIRTERDPKFYSREDILRVLKEG